MVSPARQDSCCLLRTPIKHYNASAPPSSFSIYRTLAIAIGAPSSPSNRPRQHPTACRQDLFNPTSSDSFKIIALLGPVSAVGRMNMWTSMVDEAARRPPSVDALLARAQHGPPPAAASPQQDAPLCQARSLSTAICAPATSRTADYQRAIDAQQPVDGLFDRTSRPEAGDRVAMARVHSRMVQAGWGGEWFSDLGDGVASCTAPHLLPPRLLHPALQRLRRPLGPSVSHMRRSLLWVHQPHHAD
ncbi:hypothetical protein BJ912DRAFT_1065641 [Pholiota molesta]|nr:hypothetical protein BJ912DRAFT_1065641 [Pholiota molesta]